MVESMASTSGHTVVSNENESDKTPLVSDAEEEWLAASEGGMQPGIAVFAGAVFVACFVVAIVLNRQEVSRQHPPLTKVTGGTPWAQFYSTDKVCGSCECDCAFAAAQNGCIADGSVTQDCCWECCCTQDQDQGQGQGQGQGGGEFATYGTLGDRENTDSPVVINEPGIYHSTRYNNGLPYTNEFYSHYHGAGLWWTVLFIVLTVLSCFGVYTLFIRRPSYPMWMQYERQNTNRRGC